VIVNRPGFAFRRDVAPYRTLDRGEAVTLPEKKTAFYLPFVDQPISSTKIRDDRRHGEEVRQWLPPQVWSYIEKNRLYQ
jgi:nicotinic acid mononucleotide adenylyltransferase